MSPVYAIIDAPIIAVIIGAAIILFGADQIPKLARSMGQAKKEFDAAVSAKNPPDAPVQDASVPPKPAAPPASDPSAAAPPQ
ncbi:MAG TPA: twin-arginine translocase TatA/TatE family subunit [Candidatus Eremiobacteraceae bacterium]|nr:twin-arginine translocase TatA/TatE family subunit [Candidatus Eremiobacteraceae bacterium]